uniref:Uncharacterized protein n=1 Tax=Rhizophora mucronata TaxID=61149 RepID=A0A2P2PX38_RHIMU
MAFANPQMTLLVMLENFLCCVQMSPSYLCPYSQASREKSNYNENCMATNYDSK